MSDVEGARDSTYVSKMRDLAHGLATPGSGLSGQIVRYALVGGAAAVIYLGTTTLLATTVGMSFQAALAIGFCAGLVIHFALQRAFVWTSDEEFALPMRHQIGRYAVVVIAQYGVTAAATSKLPPILGLPTEAVYLVTVPIVASVNFLVFRHGVFHGGSAAAGQS